MVRFPPSCFLAPDLEAARSIALARTEPAGGRGGALSSKRSSLLTNGGIESKLPALGPARSAVRILGASREQPHGRCRGVLQHAGSFIEIATKVDVALSCTRCAGSS